MLDAVKMPEARKRHEHVSARIFWWHETACDDAMALLCQPKLLIADEPTTSVRRDGASSDFNLAERIKRRLQYVHPS